MTRAIAALVAAAALVPVSTAHADLLDTYEDPIASPERFAWELRLGPYQPDQGDIGSAFSSVFGGDHGPYVGMELDALIYRIPYVGNIGVGGGIGWVRFESHALSPDGNTVDEKTKLILYPINVLAVLRIDVLARELGIPLLFAGKLGVDFIPWRSNTGSTSDGNGTSIGLHWGAQVALELDFLEPRAARNLDEEWGINHSFIYFELYGSLASSSLPVGDSLTFAAGLGLIF